MKPLSYTLFFALLLALGRPAAAQTVPNNGFDTWASPYGVEAPTGWLTTDDLLSYFNSAPRGSYNTGTVSKSTDVHSGTFAAKLTTLSLPTTTGGTLLLPGYLLLGAKTGVYRYNGLPIGGSNYAGRPAQMQFYYKLSGPATDSAYAFVYFSTTTNGVPSLVGGSFQYLQPSSSYTALTLPIQYGASAMPDSVHIVFNSGNARTITANTALLVDDISFSNTALAVKADASLQELLTVSPNPSPAGRFVVSSPTQPDLAAAPLVVFDVTGREVLRQPAQVAPTPTRELDLSGLALGIYTLRLDSKQGTIVRQLMVK